MQEVKHCQNGKFEVGHEIKPYHVKDEAICYGTGIIHVKGMHDFVCQLNDF